MSEPQKITPLHTIVGTLIFVLGFVALFWAWNAFGVEVSTTPATSLFVLLLCIFTIAVGYQHPNFGHVSFDRVGQVALILVFGPVTAAAVSGLASLIYPLHRLALGVAWRDVLLACFYNCGLMIFVVLGGGLFYTFASGVIPLEQISFASLFKVIGLMLVMQIINELGMSLYVFTRKGNLRNYVSLFNNGVEFAAGFIGLLVAVCYTDLHTGAFILLLAVLTMGMFLLRRYAVMRNRLSVLVGERTAELEEKSRELERKATHDKLTGLYNRRFADDYLEREIESAIRYSENFSIAIADIDHFKTVNDTYSHETGDMVLQQVSNILQEQIRSTDTLARYGGEEFLLGFPRSTSTEAYGVCEKLRAAVEAHDWTSINPGVHVTLSFGVAQIDVNSRRKTILREADERLYAAKNLGRNRVVA